MSFMEQVAKMLGVELGERFQLLDEHGREFMFEYYLTNSGIKCSARSDNEVACALLNLICGNYTIKRKPWKPNNKDDYWTVDADGVVCRCCSFNCEDADHMNYYKLGNCYRTKEEAEANLDKWNAFYASDEVLEV